MKLSKVIIQGLKWFHLSEIDRIEIDVVSPVTIVLGSNGSGKSSLLRAIGILPASRKDYLPNGWIEHHFEDSNNKLVMKSDFSKKNKPHSFILNGIELNESGVTQIQLELLEKYLRYNENVRDLSFMMLDFVNMGPAQRKEFFINTSPVDLSFTTNIHKKLSSKIREIANNSTLLHSRREEIGSKLMEKEEVEVLTTTLKSLSDDITWLDKCLYGLGPFITDLKNKRSLMNVDHTNPSDIISDIKSIYQELPLFTTLDRDDLFSSKVTLENTISHLSSTINTLGNDIRVKSDEIDKLVEQVKEADNDLHVAKEKELLALKELIKENTPSDKYLSLPDTIIESCTDELLDEIKVVISNVELSKIDRLLNQERFRRARQVLDNLKERIANGKSKIELVDEKISTLSQLDRPNPNCQMICRLKDLHLKTHGNVDDRLKHLSNSKETMIKLLKKLESNYSNLSLIVDNNVKIRQEISKYLRDIFDHYIIISSLMDRELFTNYLIYQPGTIISTVVNTVENNRRRILFTKYSKEIEKIESELLVLKTKTSISKEYLENTLSKAKDEIIKMVEEFDSIKSRIEDSKIKLHLTTRFIEIKEKISHYQNEVDNYSIATILDNDILYHEKLYSLLSEVKNKYKLKQMEVEYKLKEHEQIVAKYQEIKTTLSTVEKDRWKFELLQMATSPQGIPKKYLTDYINRSLTTVNALLKNIFTYPLEIESVVENEDLNFFFPVKTDNGTTDDLKFLSTGQKQIVNLAWNLAHLMRLSSLDIIPLFLDEIRNGMDHGHSGQLLTFIHSLIDSGKVSQVFIVDHGSLCLQSFAHCDYICLREDGCLLPEADVNNHVKIKYLGE